MSARGGLCAFALLACVACGRTELHEAVLRPPAAPPAKPVEIYVVGQGTDRPYDEVALLEALGVGSDADPEKMAHALGHRAAELGCDAVVRLRIDSGSTMVHGYGVCVRWVAGVVVAPVASPPAQAPATSPPAAAPSTSDQPL